MGWCSGTELFDRVLELLIEARQNHIAWDTLTEDLVRAFQQHDWDCESDSEYWPTVVGPAMARMKQLNPTDNPEFFRDSH